MRIDSIRRAHNMPFLRIGMRVYSKHGKKYGIVASVNASQNINVRFDGEQKPKNCHPCWEMIYFDKDGSALAEY